MHIIYHLSFAELNYQELKEIKGDIASLLRS